MDVDIGSCIYSVAGTDFSNCLMKSSRTDFFFGILILYEAFSDETNCCGTREVFILTVLGSLHAFWLCREDTVHSSGLRVGPPFLMKWHYFPEEERSFL